MAAKSDVPVLIVGSGPVGLSLSLLLARHSVRSLLVERHPGTSIHPRARGVNVRSMELFRVWGIEGAVREAGQALATARGVVWMTDLAGTELRRVATGGDPERMRAHSPTTYCGCAQDELEPLLLAHARDLGLASVQFSQEFVALDQDAAGVTATLRDRATGEQARVRAQYLIGADGAASAVRQALGLHVTGHGVLDHRMGIYFTADLADVVRPHLAMLYFTKNAAVDGLFAAVNNADRWVFMTQYHPEHGESAADFTEARCTELIRAAAGVPDLAVTIRSVLPWAMAQEVAEQFRVGRVFLAGDAAHVIPPAGGQGMNVGIHDAHNLAWKLAGVLGGWAGEELLDSYEAERLPVARAIGERALLSAAAPQRRETFDNLGQVLGMSYDSAAVIPDGTPPPEVANPVIDYIPTARPGHRAPHVWLARDGEPLSTIDLFDTAFTLLAGAAGRGWCTAAEQAGRSLGVPLRSYTIGEGGDLTDTEGAWAQTYGVAGDGAVLIRPDGYVAWRAGEGSADASGALDGALRQVLGRGIAHDEGDDGYRG